MSNMEVNSPHRGWHIFWVIAGIVVALAMALVAIFASIGADTYVGTYIKAHTSQSAAATSLSLQPGSSIQLVSSKKKTKATTSAPVTPATQFDCLATVEAAGLPTANGKVTFTRIPDAVGTAAGQRAFSDSVNVPAKSATPIQVEARICSQYEYAGAFGNAIATHKVSGVDLVSQNAFLKQFVNTTPQQWADEVFSGQISHAAAVTTMTELAQLFSTFAVSGPRQYTTLWNYHSVPGTITTSTAVRPIVLNSRQYTGDFLAFGLSEKGQSVCYNLGINVGIHGNMRLGDMRPAGLPCTSTAPHVSTPPVMSTAPHVSAPPQTTTYRPTAPVVHTVVVVHHTTTTVTPPTPPKHVTPPTPPHKTTPPTPTPTPTCASAHAASWTGTYPDHCLAPKDPSQDPSQNGAAGNGGGLNTNPGLDAPTSKGTISSTPRVNPAPPAAKPSAPATQTASNTGSSSSTTASNPASSSTTTAPQTPTPDSAQSPGADTNAPTSTQPATGTVAVPTGA